jgi:hypothetical protein
MATTNIRVHHLGELDIDAPQKNKTISIILS